MRKLHVFAGPTTFGTTWPAHVGQLTIVWHHPARRGDLAALLPSGDDVALLVDGVFHYALPPSHVELRRVLKSGLELWGTASLGAIRACELRSAGMRGTGVIFEAYCDDAECTDDEVALLHAAEPPFRPLSEPLVELREVLRSAVADGCLSRTAALEVTEELQSVWYGDRTLEFFSSLLSRHVPGKTLQDILDPVRRASARLKQLDLKVALQRIANG